MKCELVVKYLWSNDRRKSGLSGLVFCCILFFLLASSASSAAPADSLSVRKVKIYYRWDKFTIDSTYMGNAAGIREIDSLFNHCDRIIDSLYIVSSASPEGNVWYNDRLSRNRGAALSRHLATVRNDGEIGDVTIIPLGSNFPEFLKMLSGDGRVPYLDDVLAEFREHPDEHPDNVYRRVMRMRGGVPYAYIKKNILPWLRYAEIVVFSHPEYPEIPEIATDIKTGDSLAETSDDFSPLGDGLLSVAPMEMPSSRKRKYWYPALKTNLLYDAVSALNGEIEFPVGKKFSLVVEDVFPWWKWGTNDKKYCLQLWTMGVEPRWWFRRNDRKDWLSGHFAGVYAMSGKYDLQWKTSPCYQGEYWSAGLSYGYALPLCKWLNMEFSLSVGYIRSDYRHYQPDEGYEHLYRDKFKVGTVSFFGPTKAKVSLVLPIGRDSHNVRKR